MEKIFLIPPSDMSDKLPFILTLAGITYPDAEYKIYRECSALYVIEYVEKGAGTVICGGESYRIEKGDVYILLPVLSTVIIPIKRSRGRKNG